MRRTNSLVAVAVGVLVAALGFAAGSLTVADAKPSGRGVTTAKVKKIVKKELAKAGPTLAVGSATNAAHAGTADKLGGQTIRVAGARISQGSPAVTLATVGPVTLTAGCTPLPQLHAVVPGGGSISFVTPGQGNTASGGTDYLLVVGANGTGMFTFFPAGGGSPVVGSYSWLKDVSDVCVFSVDVGMG